MPRPDVAAAVAVAAVGVARLTAGLGPDGLRLDRAAHLAVHGAAREPDLPDLLALAEAIDLRGRGGAGFPFLRKLRAVDAAAARRDLAPAVVVNAMEGEPACRKDALLIERAPHLVLDGALLAARALEADDIAVGVATRTGELSLRRALAERRLPRRAVRIVRLPERFVSGEGGALIRGLSGRPALPDGRRTRTSERGLGGRPTLLSNTETCAQLAVAARLGPTGYAATGLPNEPGTTLLTVTAPTPGHRHPHQTVVEAPFGTPLSRVTATAGTPDLGQALLVGGYHGRFLDQRTAAAATVSRPGLDTLGATLGAGALIPLPRETCPLGETARIAHWLAAESAAQCGPCYLGLPDIANALDDVLDGGSPTAQDRLRNGLAAVRRRGACSHPDGSSAFVRSALTVFTDDLAAHTLGGGCHRPVIGALPLPTEAGSAAAATSAAAGEERLVVDWTLCDGHGLCAGVVPELLRLGRDGYPTLSSAPVPAHLRARARTAVRRCPTLALRMERS
ncbi:oxidoreductase [Mangrovactinospora gilvigrisea]|uniref:Oxidoreductase n=1 Tax=Mangrovactinospora gilvigrisea TaxID=1428644 RepID=A0A1J7BGE8_9ACTN|nr:NADH-quinone oxidoreductase subunit NuoF family protein [Mangrovactinospora gilvigrisea]OIV37755.1 oxidoreductase [Mangrovactinospora gilvigrisea]